MLRVYSQVTLIRYLSRTERGPATISRAMLSAQQVLHDYLLNEWAKKKNTLAGKLYNNGLIIQRAVRQVLGLTSLP